MNAPHGHVLVARLDSVGDILLSGPAVRAVAASATRVTMLVGRGRSAVARLLPGVDDVLEYDAPWVVAEPGPLDPAAVDTLVADVRRLAPPVLDALRADGRLEQAVRERLAPFWSSEEVRSLLAPS